jgi:hypothetical protein
MQNAIKCTSGFRILHAEARAGPKTFVFLPLPGFVTKTSRHFTRRRSRESYAQPQENPCSETVCARGVGEPPACDPEQLTVPNRDRGSSAESRTRNLTLLAGVACGIFRPAYPAGVARGISGRRSACANPHIAAYSACCGARRTSFA